LLSKCVFQTLRDSDSFSPSGRSQNRFWAAAAQQVLVALYARPPSALCSGLGCLKHTLTCCCLPAEHYCCRGTPRSTTLSRPTSKAAVRADGWLCC
jgi:hypothetical protein